MSGTIDYEYLDQYSDLDQPGTPSVAGEMIQRYLEAAPRRIGQLRKAIESGVAKAVQFEAHSFKSSSRSLGAIRLGELCETLENAGENNSLGESSHLLQHLEREFEDVKEALLGYVKQK